MYDIIGDVHGHATTLKNLLHSMGYKKTNGSYSHPGRKAIFVGDFINRGPEIRKTIRLIRSMVDDGNALAILGNHEINAIIYHLKDKNGFRLVNKPSKYFMSLFKTINEYATHAEEWREHLQWMRTLPLFLDLNELRIVHACWADDAIKLAAQLYTEGKIRRKTFRTIYKKPDSEIAHAVWRLTKGVNLKMPADLKIVNNKGVAPRQIRMRWWENPRGKSFQDVSFESKYALPAYTVPHEILPETHPYPENAPPIFFGHYSRGSGPHLISRNICCVDGYISGTGKLLAYRWNGEKVLNIKNLVQYPNF